MEELEEYFKKNYGDMNYRYFELMKTAEPIIWRKRQGILKREVKIHNKYVGQDVICITTRRGCCNYKEDYTNPEAPYLFFETDKWEQSLGDLFLEHITCGFDHTYCDHYVKAVINDDYRKLLEVK